MLNRKFKKWSKQGRGYSKGLGNWTCKPVNKLKTQFK